MAIEPSAPESVLIPRAAFIANAITRISCSGGLGREQRLPYGLMNATHGRPSASILRLPRRECTAPSLVFCRVSGRSILAALPRSESRKMAQSQSWVHANPDGQRHLLHARSGGHRVPPAPSRRGLKPRKETMSGI